MRETFCDAVLTCIHDHITAWHETCIGACPAKEGFGDKGAKCNDCAALRSLIIIIGNDRLGLDISAHFCGAHAFRQRRAGNRGP